MTAMMLPFILFLALYINNLEATRSRVVKVEHEVMEWVEVFAQNEDGIYSGGEVNPIHVAYANISTIRREGSVATMWSMVDYAHAKKIMDKQYMSVISQDEYDCDSMQSRTLSYEYSARNKGLGEAVLRNKIPTEWYPVAPDSLTKILFKVACKKP